MEDTFEPELKLDLCLKWLSLVVSKTRIALCD